MVDCVHKMSGRNPFKSENFVSNHILEINKQGGLGFDIATTCTTITYRYVSF